MRKLGGWAAVIAMAGLLAGCSSTPSQGTHHSQSTTSSTSTSTTTTSATTTSTIATTTTSAASNTPPADYTSAKAQWNQGSCVASAVQGQYWQQAVIDLQNAESEPGSTPSYSTAVTDLEQLITLPDMGLTSAQSADFQSDTQFLDTFFETPGLYGTAVGNCTNN